MGTRPSTELSPHSPAGWPAADRLRDALALMIRQQDSESSPKGLTATTLCHLAAVSRNALYRYHPDVLLALHRAQMRHGGPREPAKLVVAQQVRRENDVLRDQVTKLAALVDHYYAAWQESRTLLERRERQLAELRRNVQPRVFPIKT